MTSTHRARSATVAVLAALLAVLFAGPPGTAEEVDAWGTDPNSLVGTIDEVCGPGPTHDAAAARPGRIALIEWIDEAFPGVKGLAGFNCREMRNPRSGCPGRTQPSWSDCWSTHAAGRAIDVMVDRELGDLIVNTLLAPRDGIDNHLARTMGIQQLLWNGRCWSSNSHGASGITDINVLSSSCVDLHWDHIHITLSEAGADGLTSFFSTGSIPAFAPTPPEVVRDQWLVGYDRRTGDVAFQQLAEDGTFAGDPVLRDVARRWDTVVFPDVAGNGDNELLLYRERTGEVVIRELDNDARIGNWIADGDLLDPGWSLLATPDVDGDGDNELFAYNDDDGRWVLHELLPDGHLGPAVQAEGVALDLYFEAAATPDLDGDGDEELVLTRRFDGHHEVWDFVLADDEAGDAEATPGLDTSGLDADQDGVVDQGITLAPLSDELVERADPEAATEATDDGDPADLTSRAATLGAGMTAVTAVDLDHDGLDELAVVYATEDSACLAVRRVVGATVGMDALADGAAEAQDAQDPLLGGVAMTPCLVTPAEDVGRAKGRKGQGAAARAARQQAAESPSLVTPGLDGDTWLLEAPDAVDPAWTAIGIAAIGDAYELDDNAGE